MMLKDDFFLIKKWFDETIEKAKEEAIADGCPLSEMHRQLPRLKDSILKERGIDPSEFYAYEESYGDNANVEADKRKKNRSIEEQKMDQINDILYSYVYLDNENGHKKYSYKRDLAMVELKKESYENIDEVIARLKAEVEEETRKVEQSKKDEIDEKQKKQEMKDAEDEKLLGDFRKSVKGKKQKLSVEEIAEQEQEHEETPEPQPEPSKASDLEELEEFVENESEPEIEDEPEDEEIEEPEAEEIPEEIPEEAPKPKEKPKPKPAPEPEPEPQPAPESPEIQEIRKIWDNPLL